MPFPSEYQRATDHFYDFLMDVRDNTGLTSAHMAYTTAQGVLQAFRRRLSLPDAIRFAQVLPVGLRALFVADWDPHGAQLPFGSRAAMTEEVKALRPNHNFAPETAIRDVARAIRRHVDEHAFDAVLRLLPAGSIEFWDT